MQSAKQFLSLIAYQLRIYPNWIWPMTTLAMAFAISTGGLIFWKDHFTRHIVDGPFPFSFLGSMFLCICLVHITAPEPYLRKLMSIEPFTAFPATRAFNRSLLIRSRLAIITVIVSIPCLTWLTVAAFNPDLDLKASRAFREAAKNPDRLVVADATHLRQRRYLTMLPGSHVKPYSSLTPEFLEEFDIQIDFGKYLNDRLIIPNGRMQQAHWHCAVLLLASSLALLFAVLVAPNLDRPFRIGLAIAAGLVLWLLVFPPLLYNPGLAEKTYESWMIQFMNHSLAGVTCAAAAFALTVPLTEKIWMRREMP